MPQPPSSKRDIVVQIVGEVAAGGLATARRTAATRGLLVVTATAAPTIGAAAGVIATAAKVSATATAAAFAATIKHGQRRVEALKNDFRRVTIIAVLVLPFAGLQRAFDVELGALLDVLLNDLAKAFIEDDDRVPFGLFFALARIAVTPAFRRRNAQVGDWSAVLRAANFRISADISDQNNLVYAGQPYLSSCLPNVMNGIFPVQKSRAP